MATITGKRLVQILAAGKGKNPKEQGPAIGEMYLEICRKVLRRNLAASADEIIKTLEKNHFHRGGIVHQCTIDTAKQIARDGEWIQPTPESTINVEDLPDPLEKVDPSFGERFPQGPSPRTAPAGANAASKDKKKKKKAKPTNPAATAQPENQPDPQTDADDGADDEDEGEGEGDESEADDLDKEINE